MRYLGLINSASTIELRILLTVSRLMIGVLVHISNSITALAYREGKTEEKLHHLTLDKEELRKIFQYLLTQSGFKESLNRRPRD